jgi:hypothetical protein
MPNFNVHHRVSMRFTLWLVASVLLVSSAVAVARAQDPLIVTGVLDYEPVPPSVIVESVSANLVTLEFSAAGGPFTGSATLELLHDVPSEECRFQSNHEWVFSGDFDPATLQFSGTYVELVESTVGDCPENFTFVRTFDPDEADFNARLDLQTGEIVSQIPPLAFTLVVDPVVLESLAAELASPVTTRSTSDPAERSPPATSV